LCIGNESRSFHRENSSIGSSVSDISTATGGCGDSVVNAQNQWEQSGEEKSCCLSSINTFYSSVDTLIVGWPELNCVAPTTSSLSSP
jgi:hypothetical protein